MLEFLRWLKEAAELIPWRAIFLVTMFGGLLWGLYRLNKGESKFLVDDLFLNDRDRADLSKVVIVVMAGLTVYTVLVLLDKGMQVETLLLGALGIFVGGKALTAFAPPPSPPQEKGKEKQEE